MLSYYGFYVINEIREMVLGGVSFGSKLLGDAIQ